MQKTFDRLSDLVLGILPRRITGEHVLLLAIFAVGIAVRVVAADRVPNGFNNDEAGLGYDAYSILKYGVDRHGIAYPAFLIGWGSGMNALAAYLAMPFIAVFGLTEGAVRAVNLTSGLASLLVFYLLLRRISGRKVALWGAFLLAISPWHVMMSRWALESNLLPGVFLLAVWLLVRATEGRRSFVPVGVCFALCLYAYGTAYFAVPVFLLMTLVWLLWTRQLPWRNGVRSAAAFILVAIPIAAVIWVNETHAESFRLAGIGIPRMATVARYKVTSSLFGRHALEHCWGNLKNLGSLLYKQDDGLVWNAFGGHGILFRSGVLLALVGLLVELAGWRRKHLPQPRVLMLMWLATGIALGTVEDANINRVNLLWLPLVYYAAVGLRWAARRRMVGVGLVAAHLLFFASFVSEYFGRYTGTTAGAFYPSYGQAIRKATASVDGRICVTNGPVFSYAFVLFYDRTDPREFAKTVVYDGDDGEFQGVRSFGRYTFGTERCPDDTQAWILDNGEVGRFLDRAEQFYDYSNYSVAIAKKH
jgi:hypothetical protein